MSMAIVPRTDGISGRPEPATGTVAIIEYGFAHHTAICSCGWTGRRRFVRAAANLDAWGHCAREIATSQRHC
jgi:hypothetical protein